MRPPDERGAAPESGPRDYLATPPPSPDQSTPSVNTAQLDLESYRAELATTARDSSVRAALQNANADPDTELARQALEDRIASGLPFTTDSLPHPAGRGVMGALIQQAIKRGRIESIGRTPVEAPAGSRASHRHLAGEAMSAYDADRYAPTSVAVLLQLPPSNARAFAVASALGRFLDEAGTSDRLRSGRQAAGSLVDQHRLPAVLGALGLKGRRWRQLVEDWEGRYLAHRCGPVRVFLFAKPLPSSCVACGAEIVYDHVPAPPRANRGPGFAGNGSGTAAETAVVLPENGTGTAGALAQVLPPTRTDAPHLEPGFYGMEVGVEAPTAEQSEIGIGLQEGVLRKRAPACEACGHAHWTLGACREPACGCEVIPDAS